MSADGTLKPTLADRFWKARLDLDPAPDDYQGKLKLEGAMRKAVEDGKKWRVQYLVDNGVTGELKNGGALFRAASTGNLDMADMLLQNGADVHGNGEIMLTTAAYKGYAEIVTLALQNGANAAHNKSKPLTDALRSKDAKIVGLMLEHGAQLTTENVDDVLPGIACCDIDVAQSFLDHGQDLNIAGDELLFLAAANGNDALFDLLVRETGADIGRVEFWAKECDAVDSGYTMGVCMDDEQAWYADMMYERAKQAREFIAARDEQAEQARIAERNAQDDAATAFDALYKGAGTLAELREARGENGENGFTLAARGGCFTAVIDIALQDTESAVGCADLSQRHNGESALDALSAKGGLPALFDARLWRDRPQDLQKLWNDHIAPHLREDAGLEKRYADALRAVRLPMLRTRLKGRGLKS